LKGPGGVREGNGIRIERQDGSGETAAVRR
jgi:hypothetical protein